MINFEELKETNLTTYLDAIKLPELREFTEKSLSKFGTTAKLKKANKVADMVFQKFEHLGFISENSQQQFVDITLSASLLHNLFLVEDDITTILKHRVKLKEIETELNIDARLLSLVYEIIESQFGETHPIQKLKPTPNSPAGTFAESVWQVNSYKSRV